MLKKPCPTRAGVMADSRRCREPDVFAGEVLRWNIISAFDERIAKANSASIVLAELMSGRGERVASGFRKIQLHADAIGIVQEELRIAGARHDALAEFNASCLQAFAHALDIGRGEGDVV
jgi:hypothetical protein